MTNDTSKMLQLDAPTALLEYPERRFHFHSIGTSITYREVHEQASLVAAALRARGVAREELVGLLFGTSPDFLVALFGVAMAGAAIVPLPLPTGMRSLGPYLDRLRHILRAGRVRHVIANDEFALGAGVLCGDVGVHRTGDLIAEARAGAPDGAHHHRLDPNRLALVQYTSGSTGDPKGVRLTHANLSAGIDAIVRGIAVTASDVNGQWLPLHHDMGLIGLLAGVASGVEHHLWSPAAFVRNPGEWLSQFAARRATIYAGPNFSYASMLARTSDEQLRALDLSAWRIAFNGAEVIDPQCLQAFVRRFSAAGFRPGTMFPVYGLAEATLAVTFPRLGAEPEIEWVDRAVLTGEQRCVRVPAQAGDARGLISVGYPVHGHQVRITDQHGAELADGHVGQIEVRGPAVMRSYFGLSPEASGCSPDGWFKTGDLGALRGGALRVCGRLKEMVIVRGANFYPEDVEAVVRRAAGPEARTRAVAFGIDEPGAERVVVLAEAPEAGARDLVRRARERLLAELGLGPAQVEVVAIPPRGVLRTTSGKLQRLLMRQRYLAGALERTDAQPELAFAVTRAS